MFSAVAKSLATMTVWYLQEPQRNQAFVHCKCLFYILAPVTVEPLYIELEHLELPIFDTGYDA